MVRAKKQLVSGAVAVALVASMGASAAFAADGDSVFGGKISDSERTKEYTNKILEPKRNAEKLVEAKAEAQKALDAAKAETAKQEGYLAGANKALPGLEKWLKDAQAAVSPATTKVAKAEEALAGAQEKVATQEKVVAMKKGDAKVAAQATLDKYKAQAATAQAAVDAAKAELAKANKQVEIAQNALKLGQDNVAKYTKTVADAKAVQAKAQARVDQLAAVVSGDPVPSVDGGTTTPGTTTPANPADQLESPDAGQNNAEENGANPAEVAKEVRAAAAVKGEVPQTSDAAVPAAAGALAMLAGAAAVVARKRFNA